LGGDMGGSFPIRLELRACMNGQANHKRRPDLIGLKLRHRGAVLCHDFQHSRNAGGTVFALPIEHAKANQPRQVTSEEETSDVVWISNLTFPIL